ncbi:type III glutamate--ammonia ligase, partial [Gracilibacillus oryzae]|uniref:type III glutamate--ammonia ligase n=1 Tax=Gracilibacillus oryzae TaxID=1672701 RepID=UPI001885C73B
MNGVMTRNTELLEAVEKKLAEEKVQFLLASFSDINGTSRAKLVPSKRLASVCESGAGFAGFAVGDLGHGPTDPDILCIPDLSSLTILPWQKDLAWFAGTLTEDGTPWSYCPRTILLNVMERAKGMGYEMKTGVEPEFFLLNQDEKGEISPSDPFDVAKKPCYNQQALMRNYDFLSTLIKYMDDLEWGVSQADHEDANGQFEVNFNFADVLTSADRLTFFKYMIRNMAEERNLVATFMPKPFSHLTGNGCHMHLSLWNGEQNLFESDGDLRGLSDTAYYFIGGILKHARALAAIVCPTVNSYKRLSALSTSSGATWAPNHISYGGNNRTQLVRIPEAGRIEFRAMDNNANPYLAAAAILSAGLDGIENEIDPNLIISDNSVLVESI